MLTELYNYEVLLSVKLFHPPCHSIVSKKFALQFFPQIPLTCPNLYTEPCRTTDNIIVIYTEIFELLEENRENKVVVLNNDMNFLL